MFQEFAGWWFRGFCSQMMGNQTLSWCQITLHHWFLEKLCLVVLSADHPQLVIVGFVFPLLLPHFLNQNEFQMAIALFHPKQSGTGYSIFTPLVRESLCHRSWSQAADYFQIWFYSLTPKSFLFLSVCVKSVLYSFTNLNNSCKFLFFLPPSIALSWWNPLYLFLWVGPTYHPHPLSQTAAVGSFIPLNKIVWFWLKMQLPFMLQIIRQCTHIKCCYPVSVMYFQYYVFPKFVFCESQQVWPKWPTFLSSYPYYHYYYYKNTVWLIFKSWAAYILPAETEYILFLLWPFPLCDRLDSGLPAD